MNGNLEWADYAAILVMLLLSWSVGIFFGCKNRAVKVKPEKDGQTLLTRFVLGNSKMAVLPVAFSISATTLSGNSMVGVVGEVYLYGSQYLTFAVGAALGLFIASVVVIPVYRQMKYISIYEYLERRYDRSVRLSFSAVYIPAKMIFCSVALYVPALCITTLTQVPQWITITVAGTVCICYCVTGGIKAVIWTDVLQAAFMVTCNLLLICFGIQKVGGLQKAVEIGLQSGRIGHITYLETQGTRYSIWSLFFGSTVILLSAMCAGQAAVQRVLSTKGSREAQQATLSAAGLVGFFLSLTAITGLVIYVNFWSCDPFLTPHQSGIKNSDQILVYGIAHILDQPGLKGLALAGIFSGSLSTLSSYINSFATLTVEDFVRPIMKSNHRTLSDKTNVLLCKLFTFVYGVICILLAFMVPMMGGVIQAGMQVSGATGGPLLGVIFLGIFSRRANKRGVLVGLLLGISFCFWITVGAILNKRPFTTLELFEFDCANGTYSVDGTESPAFTNATNVPRDIFPLYRLSFMWHGPIGLTITFICGLLASILLGTARDKTREIDPRLMSDLLRESSLKTTSSLTTESSQITAENWEKVEMLGAVSL